METKTTVGFIGLGAMGSRMAANVQKAGYPLVVYNRTRSATEALASRGAEVADSPRAVAEHCPVVILMLSDPAAARAVTEGPDGVFAGAHDGLVLMDMSTIGPADARDMAATARERGIELINAPVLGSLEPAEKGELVVLAGGDEREIDRQKPLLQTMGRTIHYLGPNERACVVKLAINLILAGSIQLFGEAIALATRWGVPREQALDVIGGGPAISPAMKGRIPLLYDPDAPSLFALRLAHKDLWLALAAGYEAGASLPLVATAMETFGMATRKHGDEDLGRIAAFIDEVSR